MSIYKKLLEFKATVGAVKKDGKNPFHKSKYATIESVLDTIEQPLKEKGLGFVQCPMETGLKTIVFSEDDTNTIESFIPYIGATDMQKLGSAITYARRYALVSMFGLEQEDDDGNYASGKSTTQQKPPIKNYSIQETTPPIKNYSAREITLLAGAKKIPTENICKGYKIESLDVANQQLLNTIYGALLKK